MEETKKNITLVKKTKAKNNGGKIDHKAVQASANAYFEGGGIFSIPGLCLALDITKDTLFLWEAGFADKKDKDTGQGYNAALSIIIKKALLKIEQYLIESDGKNRTTKDMAILKRYYGYGDGKADDSDGVNIDLGRFDEFSG